MTLRLGVDRQGSEIVATNLQMERPLPSIDVISLEASASVNGTGAIAGSILTCHRVASLKGFGTA